MRKILLILFIFLIPLAYAGLISSPPPLPEGSPSLQHYLYDIFANLHVLEVRTAVSSRTPSEGQMESVTDDSSVYDFYIYLNDGWRKWSSNQFDITFDGDITFSSGAGLAFGSMYNHDTATSVTIASINTPVRIPSGFTVGQLNNATFGNAREITVSVAGKYKIDWSISFTTDAANKEIEGFVMIDNVANTQSSAHRLIGTKTDTGNMGGTCILSLAADAVVSLGVSNETAGGDLDVNIEHANLSLTMVGG